MIPARLNRFVDNRDDLREPLINRHDNRIFVKIANDFNDGEADAFNCARMRVHRGMQFA